jgi:hypothetical protein
MDEKIKVKTKNRFNVKIKTNSEQHTLFDRIVDKIGIIHQLKPIPLLMNSKKKRKTKNYI